MSNNKFMNAMENEVKTAKAEEIAKKAQEIREANAQFVKNITPNTIVKTTEDVKKGDYYMTKDERGNKYMVSGNLKSKVVIISGRYCYVTGATDEELKEDENYIRLALARGDIQLPMEFGFTLSGRYVARVVNIYGMPTYTVGKTETDRAEDEIKARICYAKLRKTGLGDVATAEDLVEAGLNPTKEFEKDGYRYIYFADQKCARNFDGEKVADISDIADTLSIDTAIELLKGRIETPRCDYDEEDDYDDEENDENWWDEDGCYNCSNFNFVCCPHTGTPRL